MADDDLFPDDADLSDLSASAAAAAPPTSAASASASASAAASAPAAAAADVDPDADLFPPPQRAAFSGRRIRDDVYTVVERDESKVAPSRDLPKLVKHIKVRCFLIPTHVSPLLFVFNSSYVLTTSTLPIHSRHRTSKPSHITPT
jgi:hypothetical protein